MTARLSAAIERNGRWKMLAYASIVTLAIATAVSSALFSFTSTSPVPASAGSVTLTNSKENAAIVDASNMRPDDTRQDTLTITNSGSLPATYKIQSTGLVNNALAGVLDLTIDNMTSGTPVLVDSGKFNAFPNNKSLGTFAAGETRTYRFTIAWPSGSTSPTLQGLSTTQTFKWTATQ
jgi:spore coat-associated protein N